MAHGRILNGGHDFPRLLGGFDVGHHYAESAGVHGAREEVIETLGHAHERRDRRGFEHGQKIGYTFAIER